jgi:hypothetical protein
MVQFTSSALLAILLTSIGSDAFTLRHIPPVRSVATLQMVGRSFEKTKYHHVLNVVHSSIDIGAWTGVRESDPTSHGLNPTATSRGFLTEVLFNFVFFFSGT